MICLSTNAGHFVCLPFSTTWSVACSRPKATRTSLAGSAIHQTAAKDISNATIQYSATIGSDDATMLEALDAAVSSCTVSDGAAVYEAVVDARITPTMAGNKKKADIEFRIVRRVF